MVSENAEICLESFKERVKMKKIAEEGLEKITAVLNLKPSKKDRSL